MASEYGVRWTTDSGIDLVYVMPLEQATHFLNDVVAVSKVEFAKSGADFSAVVGNYILVSREDAHSDWEEVNGK